MTEFLKNNPIALRHCLLYLYLQEKSVEKAFDDFCETVGQDVIEKEEFQFWFYQFKQVKFGDEENLLAGLRGIISRDKSQLRACVLYEFLTTKQQFENRPLPVFTKFQNFCKTLGDDAMEYRDFDFWFYRFFNGEFDLNFERDSDKKVYELEDMPFHIITNIVEYLNIGDRLALEKTSQSLCSFSQNQLLFHDKLTFEADSTIANIIFGEKDKISYKKKRNNCLTEFRNTEKVLRGVSFLNQAFQDFKKILDNPKIYLDSLTIWFWDSELSEGSIEDALNFTHPLHVNHIYLRAQSRKALLNILPSLKPGFLSKITIEIFSDETAIEEVVEMEQWKQAKYLDMQYTNFIGPLHHLFHFKEFDVCCSELSVEDICQMKEALFNSPDFERCTIQVDNHLNLDAIKIEFYDAIHSPNSYHFSIPDSNEYFEIFAKRWEISIKRIKK